MIEQAKLKQLLHYDQLTGEFTWIGNGVKAGFKDKDGYIIIKVCGRPYRAHLLAFLFMTGKMPKKADHKDNVRDNNAWLNLRECNDSQNAQNALIRSDNTSGVKGVYWNKQLKRWVVRIMVNNKRKSCGTYAKLEDAERAAQVAREYYHKDFANHGV
ncbi:HNH homing endonuclease [Erwinia phage Mauresque]|nr:HNH homing endonuclease [Erwinia phage Mauresque]